jgi:transposase-like protein
MLRPDREPIGVEHPVEVDETLVGGKTRGEGRGVHHKILVVGAVEVRTRKPSEDRSAEGTEQHRDGKPVRRPTYAGRIRLTVVPDREGETLTSFVTQNVAQGSAVTTDGWAGYDSLAGLGYWHRKIVIQGDHSRTDAYLPMIHLIFSNLKTWLAGTHHGVSPQHLQSYLDEYVFRFNRRFYPMTAFNSVLGLAAHTVAPTYEELYRGERHVAA